MNVNWRLTFGMISGSRGIHVKYVNSFEPDSDFQWERWFSVWNLWGCSPPPPTPFLSLFFSLSVLGLDQLTHGVGVITWRQMPRWNRKHSASHYDASNHREPVFIVWGQLTLCSGFTAEKWLWACSCGKIRKSHLLTFSLLFIKNNLHCLFFSLQKLYMFIIENC